MATVRRKMHTLPPQNYVGKKQVAFTICEKDRRPGLADSRIVDGLVPILEEATRQFECNVPIYTFMPDYLHILVAGTTDSANSHKAISRFKTRAGWWLYRNDPSLSMQGDCWDHIVRYFEGWENQARYIALNPVRKGLAVDIEAWPFTGSIGYNLRETLQDVFWP